MVLYWLSVSRSLAISSAWQSSFSLRLAARICSTFSVSKRPAPCVTHISRGQRLKIKSARRRAVGVLEMSSASAGAAPEESYL
eukprot:7381101-Prymnesium_polylepis.2